jgi:hypothetical protein
MPWQSCKAVTHFEAFRPTWDDLNKRRYGSNPYFDGRFVACLLRHFGTGDEELWIHKTNDTVDAALITNKMRAGVEGLFAPVQAQIAPVLAERPELLWTLFRRFSATSVALDLLGQDPEFSVVFALDESDSLRKQQHALTVGIDVDGRFEDYWAGRGKKLRSNLQRYQNRVAKAGHVSRFDHHSSPDAVAGAFVRYAELEGAGWKAKAGTQISLDNAQGRFYSDVLRAFAETDNAVAYELYLDERLVASRLCIRSDDMLIMLKTTYDETLSSFAVGRLLLFEVLRHEFTTKRVKRIEFYTNATADQVSWSTRQRPISHITLYRYGWVGRLHGKMLSRRKTPTGVVEEAD